MYTDQSAGRETKSFTGIDPIFAGCAGRVAVRTGVQQTPALAEAPTLLRTPGSSQERLSRRRHEGLHTAFCALGDCDRRRLSLWLSGLAALRLPPACPCQRNKVVLSGKQRKLADSGVKIIAALASLPKMGGMSLPGQTQLSIGTLRPEGLPCASILGTRGCPAHRRLCCPAAA